MHWTKPLLSQLLHLVTGCWFLVTGHALRACPVRRNDRIGVTRHWLLPLPLLLLLSLACEVEVPTETYDNPLDIEETEKEGIETPALVFFPDSVSVNVGDPVTIQLFALEVENLGGLHVQVTYDKNKLSLSSISVGYFFQGEAYPIFLYEDDNGSGTIDIFTSFLGTDSVSVSGTGNLAFIVFSTTAPGQSSLQYTSECELVDPDDNPIEINGFGEGVIDAR